MVFALVSSGYRADRGRRAARDLRSSIDNIDAALILLLAERFKVTKAVGEYKAAAGLPPADPDREKVQIARLRRLAEEANSTRASARVSFGL